MTQLKIFDINESFEKDLELAKFRNSSQVHLSLEVRWVKMIERTYGKKAKAVVGYEGEKVTYLSLGNFFHSSSFGRKVLICGAFLDYGAGIHLDHDDTFLHRHKIMESRHEKYLTKAIQLEAKGNFQSIAIMDLTLIDNEYPERFISSRARNDLKRSLKNEIVIEKDLKFFPDFYDMYKRKMKEFGTPHHELKFFENMFEDFSNEIRFSIAYVSNCPATASLDLQIGKNRYHLYSVSNSFAPNVGAGDFLFWDGVKSALIEGVEKYWLGRSVAGSGVEFFKRKWNPSFFGYLETVYTSNLRAGMPVALQVSPKSRLFVGVWKRIPDSVSNAMGPTIRRLIP